MKRYITYIVVFALVILVVDRLAGVAADYLIEHAISGETQKNEYICDHTSEDILVMGSSRAVHHYDPRIIEDSLGMSCYNCGYDGCGSITADGLLKIILQRYGPKMIIYEVTPEFDYLQSDKDNTQYLGPLKNYYDREGVDSVFLMIDPDECLKMVSRLYRINSKSILMLSENLMKRNETIQGFFTENRTMQYEPVIDETREPLDLDSVKVVCLKDIISLCQQYNVKLIFAVSPSYKKSDDYKYEFAKTLADGNHIPFINHYCDTTLNRNAELFYDQVHMNEDGAREYTKCFASQLKRELFCY